jgi:hypothetical protein
LFSFPDVPNGMTLSDIQMCCLPDQSFKRDSGSQASTFILGLDGGSAASLVYIAGDGPNHTSTLQMLCSGEIGLLVYTSPDIGSYRSPGDLTVPAMTSVITAKWFGF